MSDWLGGFRVFAGTLCAVFGLCRVGVAGCLIFRVVLVVGCLPWLLVLCHVVRVC